MINNSINTYNNRLYCVGTAVINSIVKFGSKAIDKAILFRVSDDEQVEGLDMGECGVEAYPEFKRAF